MPAAQRFRYTLVAGATAVVIGVGFTVVGFNRQAAPPATRTAADVPLVVAEPAGEPDTGTDLLDETILPSSATPSPSPSVTSATPVTKAPTKAATKPATSSKRRTTAPADKPKPKNAPATSGSILDQVLDHINAARGDEGLAALSLDSSLSKAAALHNQRMIDGCGLNHQCSGEGGIGDRFSAQGVQWRSAGENIGFGFAGAADSEIVKAANGLCDSMLAEVPPADGHRKNLLSKDFNRIGLSVVRESGGKVWLTQDFVG
ncbi:CAP domain-containing protein [Actinoplanes sp. NPDC048791]|uniref:CAP domain-containing protein n=1 Tax=Actinoplanes sp. NPDC048791 TaxID=3154623 RepID=UPI0033BFDA8C